MSRLQAQPLRHLKSPTFLFFARLFPHLFALLLSSALAVGFVTAPRYSAWPVLPVLATWSVVVWLLDPGLRLTARNLSRWGGWIGAGVVAAGAALGAYVILRHPFPPSLAIPLLLASTAGFALRPIFAFAAERSGSTGWEMVRWFVLLIVAALVIHPFATRGLVGGGDALHYARQLADFIEQSTAGVFPVLAGQSSHAFNGDIHPLRTAPFFQYAGLAAYGLSGGNASAFAAQNLVLLGSYLTAVWATYLCLLLLASHRPWLVLLLALLFACSPGILPLAFSGDMVASWMTLPFLAPLLLCVVRLRESPRPALWLTAAAALAAALWYAHSPIALWASFAAALGSLPWLLNGKGFWERSLLTAGAATLFALLALFHFVSVVELEMPQDPGLIAAFTNGGVMENLRVGWTGFLRPVSPGALRLLSDLQLSPGLWVAALLGLASLRSGGPTKWALAVALLGLLALLFPAKEVAGVLWPQLPDVVLNATEKWPMQRFYPIMTVLAVFIAALGLRGGWTDSRPARLILALILLAGVGYSVVESQKFSRRGRAITSLPWLSDLKLLPENTPLSRYSHEYFFSVPRYFTHGVTDPSVETRLLSHESMEPIRPDFEPGLAVDDLQTLRLEYNDGGARILPSVVLEPGRRYVLRFAFTDPPPRGVLIAASPRVYREYSLPQSGEQRAFGAGPTNANGFTLWTTGTTPELVELHFIRSGGSKEDRFFRSVTFGALRADSLPVTVTSLIPFEASLRSAEAVWVETPRLYLPGYRAEVDGEPVRVSRSPDGLVMFPAKAQAARVSLVYDGGLRLRLAFWLSLTAWLAVAGCVAVSLRGRTETAALRIVSLLPRVGLAGVFLGLGTAGSYALPSIVHSWQAPAPPAEGRLALNATLPLGLVSVSEVIATLQHPEGEDLVFLHYLDGKQLQVGLLRSDGTREQGPAIPVNYLARHAIDITEEPGELGSPSRLTVLLNDRKVLTAPRVGPATTPYLLDLPAGSVRTSSGLQPFTGTLRRIPTRR